MRSFFRKAQREKAKRDEEKYLREPVWVKMEAVMKKMKSTYEANPWIFTDQAAMAVLESLRTDFERQESEIDKLTEDEKVKAHNDLEERMDRMHDKKKLEHQLRTMQLEFEKVTELVTLHNRDKDLRDGKRL